MRAAVYQTFKGPIEVKEVPDPIPHEDGVIVRVKATGLCRSDWHAWMGHDTDVVLPHVPGHELAGIIEAKGKNVKKFNVGDRITVPFVCGCGTCNQCKSGNHQVCDAQSQPGFTHWGSFAEYVALDHADTNLVKLPEEIDDVTAAALGCRFITSFRAVVAQGKVSEGQFVAVHGCGGVGLSAILIAKALGAEVVAIDINDDTLDFAKSIGADHVINAMENARVVEEIRALTNGGAHVSLDALGSATTCYNSISGLRKRGKHIQVGLMTGLEQETKVPIARILADELEVIGSHGMQAYKYPEMLEMIKKGELHPEKLIERIISLQDATLELPKMDAFENKGILIIDSF